MISNKDYYGDNRDHPALTPAVLANGERFLRTLNTFIAYCQSRGKVFKISPATKTQLSTSVGGWRAPECASGSPLSSHKEARGGDLFDGLAGEETTGAIGGWLLGDKEAQKFCRELGLYFEHPTKTKGKYSYWLHATNRRPASGQLFFYP